MTMRDNGAKWHGCNSAWVKCAENNAVNLIKMPKIHQKLFYFILTVAACIQECHD